MGEKLTPQQKAGQKLRQLLKENNISQEQFAKLFNIDVRTCNRYINVGINKIDVLQQLADYFNIDIEEFFED
ncbi:MAG: helix-turn-helix transcriptional regulator [Erysipelotrichaceae bacterium]|nr:helix-turn-helix transcriptional regulator [Erysipelotrichaceae bacterium]